MTPSGIQPPPADYWLGVGYERFSTDNQSSTIEQIGVNNEIADEKGGSIVEHFDDEGIPRSLSERPGLLRMFEYVEGHPEVKYVVVNELERLTAGVSQRAKVTSMCKRLGITLLTEDMGLIDPHDEEKMHEADQRAVASAGEVLKIRRRTRRSLRQKARNGVSIMRPPYGTVMLGGGHMEIHPDEHKWLLQMFEWAVAGKSLGEIRNLLNTEGVPTKGGKSHWSTTAIKGILENPFYKGTMVWGLRRTLRDGDGRTYRVNRELDDPEVITRPSPLGELVPSGTWDKVQALHAERRENVRARSNPEPRVLDNRVFCARCGYKMYSRDNGRRSTGKNQWQYVCYTPSRPARKPLPEFNNVLCSTPHSVSLKYILAALSGAENTLGLELDRTISLGQGGNLDRKRQRLLTEIDAAEKRKENAEEMGVQGGMSVAKVIARKKLEDEIIAEKSSELADLLASEGGVQVMPYAGQYEAKVLEIAERLSDDSASVSRRMALLDRVGLDRIYVDKPLLRLHFRD